MAGASLVAQTVKNPPAMWETWVQSLGQEDSLEKGMATHSSSGILLPREFHGQRSLVGYSTESDATEQLSTAQHYNSHIVTNHPVLSI